MRNLMFLTVFMAALPLSALAEDTPATAELQTDPATIALEQKINARKDLQKTIYSAVETRAPRERRQMLDAVATSEKARVRRTNLDLAPGEKIKYQKPNINVKNSREMRKYMQKVFVEPLDNAAIEPTTEQVQE